MKYIFTSKLSPNTLKNFNDWQAIRHLMPNLDVVRKEYVIFTSEVLFNSLRVEQGDMSSQDNFDIPKFTVVIKDKLLCKNSRKYKASSVTHI